jgi:hypothetical protein
MKTLTKLHVLTRTARRLVYVVGLFIITAPIAVHAQAWSQILSSTRATDWSGAGVSGGIPTRTTICSTLSAGATAAQINSAIAACPSGQVVKLNAGTFTLAGGLVFGKSNVTLRGAGSEQTRLVINGTTSGCSLFYGAAVQMCTNSGNIGTANGGSPGPDHASTWTNGYAKGTTVVTLGNTTGLVVGATIYLDQLNDPADGFPSAGDLYLCESSAPCSGEGGNSWARSGRVQTEVHEVTAIAGNAVTISPPVISPNYRTSQSPGAWWGDSGTNIEKSGIEDLTIDFTGGGQTGIELVNAKNCWFKGLRVIRTGGPGSFVFHIVIVNGFRITTRDSYFYGPNVQGNTQYTYTPHVSGSLLFENNIMHDGVSPMTSNDPESGSVYAYNYCDGTHYSACIQNHNSGDLYNLYEGNNSDSIHVDDIHGTHFFLTYFRNHLDGNTHNSGSVAARSAFAFNGHARFMNVIGNVMGDTTQWSTYETESVDSGSSIFNLGFKGNCANCTNMPNDSNVKRTLLRWGNWDSVTNSTRFVTAEVPSGIPTYPNSVPASQSLPSSLYLVAKPAFFGSVPWPPIGPDVTAGNLTGSGGHANKLPAQLCFDSAANDAAYGTSNPRVKLFSAAACYGAGSTIPTAPTNLRIIR